MSETAAPPKKPNAFVTLSILMLGTAFAAIAAQSLRSFGSQQGWAPVNVQDAANATFLVLFLLMVMWRGIRLRPRILVPLWAVSALSITLILHFAHITLAVLKVSP
jgi:hypothetical protein